MSTERPDPGDRPERHPSAAYDIAFPKNPRPIVIIGTGGIVKDAHLPAYRKAGYPVWGLVNRTVARAQALADEYDINRVFGNVADAVAAAPVDAVYDIALMPEQYARTLEALPDGAAVLIQKPLGHTLRQARELQEICRRKDLVAAVNTQLRFAPYVAVVRRLLSEDAIGEVYDFDLRVTVNTPWHLFPHVFGLPRLEIPMHSVHYIDLVRSFFGDPDGVSATTVRHPTKPDVATTRSSILMRYHDRPLRAVIGTNHDHAFGSNYQESFIKWEGTRGAIRLQMGLLLDYPKGGPDALTIYRCDLPELGWHSIPFEGSWFPEAFMGSMGALMRYVEGSVSDLPTSVDDVLKTMASVEAAYESQREGGTPLGL